MASSVTKGAFRITAQIFGEDLIRSYSKLVIEKQTEMEGYINYFLNLGRYDQTMSVYKWNQKAN